MDRRAGTIDSSPARPPMPAWHRVLISTLMGGVLGALCATERLSAPWSAASGLTVATVEWFGLRWAERLGLLRDRRAFALLPEEDRRLAKRTDRWASVAYYAGIAAALAFVAAVDRWRPPGEAALAVAIWLV